MAKNSGERILVADDDATSRKLLTRILTRDVYPRLRALGDRLAAGSQDIIDEFGLPGYAVNVGPKGCVMYTPGRVTSNGL